MENIAIPCIDPDNTSDGCKKLYQVQRCSMQTPFLDGCAGVTCARHYYIRCREESHNKLLEERK